MSSKPTFLNKAIAWLKYFGVMLIKLLGWPYGLIIFPVAFPMRKAIRRNRQRGGVLKWLMFPLWITLDDEDDFGEHWWLLENDLKPNFLTAWRWGYLRNNCWNLNSVLVVPHKVQKLIQGRNTSKQEWTQHCRFKWEIHITDNVWLDGWDVNQGDRLSQKYTREGMQFVWYTPWMFYAPLLFRASYAGIKWGWLINYKLGWNNRGEVLLDFKIMRDKGYKKHWI